MSAIPAPIDRELDARRPFDSVIILIVGALMVLGTVLVYSASSRVTGKPFDLKNLFDTPLRQGLFAVAGFAAMVWAAYVPYRVWAWDRPRDGWWVATLYVIAFVLLVAMLIPGIGTERLGARRAIVVLTSPISLSFQPTEVAKVILPIWLAALLTRPWCDIRSYRNGLFPAVASAGLLIGLTGIEDFGTAALMGALFLAMLAISGARWWHVLMVAAVGFTAGVRLLMWKMYRFDRMVNFFFVKPDPTDEGYQIEQSLIAIGSGGWWGRGLGEGVQSHGYLPQANNDFIFSILCEQLGIAGGIAVIAIFLLLLWRGWRIARAADNNFGHLLAIGITLLICLQAAFNIGVVTNSVPTKGISLPFVSAGGSGILFLGLAAGVLASVGQHRTTPRSG